MKLIPLSQGKFAQIDDEDFSLVSQWNWHADKHRRTWYAATNLRLSSRKVKMYMHRLIMRTPEGMKVDHIDYDGTNNQKSNMRNCTNGQNLQGAHCKDNTKGTCWDKRNNKFMSSIWYDGKGHFLGYYDTVEDAALAYNNAALKHFGEFARLNDI
jgi:hypothetical protein